MKLFSPQLHLRLLMLLMAMLCSLLATQAYWQQVTNYDELQRLRNVEQRVAYLRASKARLEKSVYDRLSPSYKSELVRLDAEEAIAELATRAIQVRRMHRRGVPEQLQISINQSISTEHELAEILALLKRIRMLPSVVVQTIEVKGNELWVSRIEKVCPEAEVIRRK